LCLLEDFKALLELLQLLDAAFVLEKSYPRGNQLVSYCPPRGLKLARYHLVGEVLQEFVQVLDRLARFTSTGTRRRFTALLGVLGIMGSTESGGGEVSSLLYNVGSDVGTLDQQL
jgi:hypothetical protein